MTLIYKIVPQALWRAAEALAEFDGSQVDLDDGFIHLSTGAQVRETAAKHFAGERDLLLVAIDAERLGDGLKWEPSRGGDLFPHLYGDLEVRHARSVRDVDLDEAGIPLLGDLA
jgi:uncharacterized protein (DUF952 family)